MGAFESQTSREQVGYPIPPMERTNSGTLKTRRWINTEPCYINDETLDEPMTPWWIRCFYTPSNHDNCDTEKRRFSNLFYFGKHEAEFHLFVIHSCSSSMQCTQLC